MKFLFPQENPPMLPDGANIDEGCTWLLAVMDPSDRRRKFVSSLLTYYLEHGYLTEKQMKSLRSLASKAIASFLNGEFESQGATRAKVETLGFGRVIEFQRPTDEDELLE